MRNLIQTFLRNERGAVAIEALIITPVLAFLFIISFIFFDAFRTYNTSVKATYAVADVLSRQTELVYGSDIDGLGNIFQHITRNVAGSDIRVSEIAWDGTEYRVTWSHPTGSRTRLRDSDIPSITNQLPIMATGERVIVTESFVPYTPFFDIGMDDLEFTNFTVTRPRFAGQLPFDDGVDPSCTSCNWGDGDYDDTGTDDPGLDDSGWTG
ncbi:hypothetical protein HKCCE2091_07270 [Rhodobacterales bacterium HKCCE2091]|nr:hypothetical protein [Rhodobacterales bacterium HKCCE2091]